MGILTKELLNKKLVEFSNYEVTVASLFAILLVILGTWIVLLVLRKALHRTSREKHIESGKKHSIYLLIKYFLWIIAITVSLDIVGINLTLLVASSAALFVGLGLGMQQIFKDLVSGIFLLFEGTIQKNDIIEVDNMVVQVNEINLRTSMVTSRDDIYMIIPNHKFIEDNVINWSHNSKLTRFHLKVGVSYGSDVDLVHEVLHDCMKEHPDISRQKRHEPIVRFTDFGESSLNFELLFWSENVFRIESTLSDLRFTVWKRLKQNGIVVPFPQRDLHLKSSQIGALQ